MAESTE